MTTSIANTSQVLNMSVQWLIISPLGDHRRQERMTKETSQSVERRPGQILERHDLAEVGRGGSAVRAHD